MNDLDERIRQLRKRIRQLVDGKILEDGSFEETFLGDPTAAMYALAQAYLEADRHDEELETLRRVVDYQTKDKGEYSDDTMIALRNLLFGLEHHGRAEEASEVRARMTSIYAHAFEDAEPRAIELLIDCLQFIRRESDKLEINEQRAIMNQVFELDINILSRDEANEVIEFIRRALGILSEKGLTTKALEYAPKVLERCRQIYGTDSREARSIFTELAEIYIIRCGELAPEDSSELRAELIKHYTDARGDESAGNSLDAINQLVDNLIVLARIVFEHRDAPEFYAAQLPRVINDVNDTALNPTEDDDFDVFDLARHVVYSLNHYYFVAEANAMIDEMIRLSVKLFGESDARTLSLQRDKAVLLDELDREDEAQALRQTLPPDARGILDDFNVGRNHPFSMEIIELQSTIERIKSEVGDDSPELIEPMHDLARYYHEADMLDDEIKVLRELLELRLKNEDTGLAYVADTLRDLVMLFDNAGITDEQSDATQQQLMLYQDFLEGEPPEVVSLLLTSLQELHENANACEEWGGDGEALALRDQMMRVDEAIFDRENRQSGITIAFDLIYGLNLNELSGHAKPIAEKTVALCEELYGAEDARTQRARELLAESSAEGASINDALDDENDLESLGQHALDGLRRLADAQRQARQFDLELVNRRRVVEIYYETYGSVETWTVRQMVHGQRLVDEWLDRAERLERTEEVTSAREKLSAIEKQLEDYTNTTPDQALTDIRRMLGK